MFKWFISIFDGVWTLQFIEQIKLNTLTNDYQHSIINNEHERGLHMPKGKKIIEKTESKLIIGLRAWMKCVWTPWTKNYFKIAGGRESVEKAIDKKLETVRRKRPALPYTIYCVRCTYVLYNQWSVNKMLDKHHSTIANNSIIFKYQRC